LGASVDITKMNIDSGFVVSSREVENADPEDVCKFLVDRDARGRTQSHNRGCEFLGSRGVKGCGCIVTLAEGTVDSFVGQLRAFFNSIGKNAAWRPKYKWSNPCDSLEVKKYLKALGLEQREAHVSPTQAPPLFSDKIRVLITEIDRRYEALGEEGTFAQKYVLKRDKAFFLISWWAADRAGDLGQIMGVEVTELSNGYFLLNHTLGKTIRESGGQTVVIPSLVGDPVMDPVAALKELVALMQLEGLDPIHNFVFRPMERPSHSTISRDKCLNSGDATCRMRLYFKSLGLGEQSFTAHSSRAGCATTLLMLGVSKDKVKAHARWATDQMVKHYTRVDEVLTQSNTVEILKNAVVEGDDGCSEAGRIGALYKSLNEGIGQTPAFNPK
jgi:integrase